MAEDETSVSGSVSGGGNTLRNVLLALAALYVCGSVYFFADSHWRMEKLEQRATQAETNSVDLAKRLDAANSELRAETRALGAEVGLTQKQLSTRAAALQSQQN